MSTHSVSDGSAIPSPNSKPSCCANHAQKVIFPANPSSAQQEQGELPDLTSLQVIASDPDTACHGCPIQEAISEAESGVPQNGHAEGLAVAPVGDNGASHGDATHAAPTPRYRPAYELADAAHERLGRSTHTPVLKA